MCWYRFTTATKSATDTGPDRACRTKSKDPDHEVRLSFMFLRFEYLPCVKNERVFTFVPAPLAASTYALEETSATVR